MKKKFLAAVLALNLCLPLVPTALAAGKEYYPATSDELHVALKDAAKNPGSVIVLEGKDYISDSGYDIYGGIYDEEKGEYVMHDIELTIRGTQGTRLLSEDRDGCVLSISAGPNVTLENLTLGHTAGKDEIYLSDVCGQDADVIDVSEANVAIQNCDLFGCGWVGIYAGIGATATVENSIIHDCSSHAVTVAWGSEVSFVGCRFSGNGYIRDLTGGAALEYAQQVASENLVHHGAPPYASTSSVSFVDCDFTGNRTPHFASEEVCVTVKNCTFSDNAWPETEALESGTMICGEDDRQVDYTCAANGKLAVSGDLVEGELVLAAMYNADGKFLGVEVLSADKLTAWLDTTAAKVKLFWLGSGQVPQSAAATLWER